MKKRNNNKCFIFVGPVNGNGVEMEEKERNRPLGVMLKEDQLC